MADNNVDNNVAAVVDDLDEVVETKIERLKSDDPKVTLFSITFDNFEDLPSNKKGHAVHSSQFSCFGSQWRLSNYTGGHKESLDGMVALFLERCSEGRKLPLKYSLAVDLKDSSDRISRQGRVIFCENFAWGWADFCSRKEIIGSGDGDDKGYLVKGALSVHVGMQLDEFIPKNPASSIMIKLFDDENSADVVFEICEQQQNQSISESDRKRARTSTAKLYHAHRFILQHHSQELSALCATSDGMQPIIITDVKPEVFRHLLYYVYGGEITGDDFVGNERELINAADKYGVTNLKLEAEVWYVNITVITIDNMIDSLLYAHAMNCALLKESVMDFVMHNKEEVVQRVSFQDVPGDVCNDLLAAVLRHGEGKDSSSDNEDEDETDAEKTYIKMRIRDLRQKLDDKGLDIDGSREALIAKLKKCS